MHAVSWHLDEPVLAAGDSMGYISVYRAERLVGGCDAGVGEVRGLRGRGAGVLVGGPRGLSLVAWDAGELRPVFDEDAVGAIVGGGEAVYCCMGRGGVAAVKVGVGSTVGEWGADENMACVDRVGESDNVFVAGSDRGDLYMFDQRHGDEPVRQFTPWKMRGAQISAGIRGVAVDDAGAFAVVADAGKGITVVHLASGGLVGSAELVFVPAAVRFCRGNLYIAGHDWEGRGPNALHRFDIECRPLRPAPVSASAVYSMDVHPRTGSLAAAGFTKSQKWLEHSSELIDVYVNPPVRSYSLANVEPPVQLGNGGD